MKKDKETSKKKVSKKSKGDVEAKGFAKPLEISDELAAIVGGKPKPRPKVVKKLWKYIKENKLQDKKNRRVINPDKKMAKVFGKEPFDMFVMNKKLGKHLG